MPIGFVGPALQGANFIGRVGIPLLQQAGLAAGMAGIGAGINALTNKPQPTGPQLTGRQKLNQAWGKIPDNLFSHQGHQGGRFAYAGYRGAEPIYYDAQGNAYDAVSGRLRYAAKPRAGSGSGSTGGGSLGGGSSAAERAFQTEKSRVAQLTAQDPELQRYEAARLKAVTPGATPEQVQSAEDIGMQMWAKANPTLAAKVKPGQAGYDAIQGSMAGQAVRQGFGYQTPQQITMTPPPGINIPQGFPAVQSIQPAEAYTTQGLQLDPEMTKKFQALLNQTKQ